MTQLPSVASSPPVSSAAADSPAERRAVYDGANPADAK